MWAVMVLAVAVDPYYVYFLESTVYLCVQRFHAISIRLHEQASI